MTTYFKTLLLTTVVTVLSASTSAMADFRDYNQKAWNQPGRTSSRSVARSGRVYRAPAPVIVRTESAPSAVAQAPTTERRFSYEPAAQGETSGGCGCGTSVRSEQAPETAERSTETRRSFSYEPSMDSGISQPSVRSYSAPRMPSSRSSRGPAYLLPKTDPNKYRGF